MDSPISKLKALLIATYPHNFLLSVFVILGLAMGGSLTIINIAFAFAVWWFLVSSITVLNVIADWEVDTINRKNLFVHKNLSKKELFPFFIFLAGASIVLSFLGTQLLQSAVLVSLLIGVLYSFEKLRLKEVLLVNYLVMGLTWGALGTIIGLAVSAHQISALQWNVIAIMGAYIFIASQIKDFEDVEGDKNGSTLPKLKRYYKPTTYVILNYVFFLTLFIMILTGALPSKFMLGFLVLPAYIILFDNFMKARTRAEYRRIHIEVMLLVDIFVLLFAAVFLI